MWVNYYGCYGGGDSSKSKSANSDYYSQLSNASIAINTLSSLPTVVETTWDNVVRKNLDIPFLKEVKPSDYAQGFKTINPVTKEVKPALDMVKAAHTIKNLGRGLALADVAITAGTAITDYSNGKYASASARVGVTVVTLAVSAIPGVGPVIAFGIGMADALWGQQFYDYVQETYDNW